MASRFRRLNQLSLEIEEPSINLTPLIDVVFSILIMFIVVAPLLELDRIVLASANHESDKTLSVKESGPLSIHVHQDNTIWLNRKQVEEADFLPLLKLEKQKNPSALPQVYHDKRAYFGTYQMIKNSLEAAGFEQMDLVLKPT